MSNSTELTQEFTYVMSNVTSSIDGLRSALDDLCVVATKIESKIAELREIEHVLSVQKAEVDRRLRDVEKKELEIAKRERCVEKRNVEGSTQSNNIILNVGGHRFSIARATLLKFKGSYFESIIGTNKCTGEVFIDRNPKFFAILLNYMRDGRIHHEDVSTVDQLDLIREFEFFKIPYPSCFETVPNNNFAQETDNLFCGTPKEALVAIKNWLPRTRFTLIYKATTDGFSSKSFHRACDNKGPTLTVIQTPEGYLFGGYTPCSWNTSGNYYSHPQMFLFTLTNPHSIPPTRFPLRQFDPLGVWCRADRCAIFGAGYDLCVGSDSYRISRNSYFNFPCSFIDSIGFGNITFTGSRNFKTKEIETYACS